MPDPIREEAERLQNMVWQLFVARKFESPDVENYVGSYRMTPDQTNAHGADVIESILRAHVTPPPTLPTLANAVAVLNEHRHRDSDQWYVDSERVDVYFARERETYNVLREFEAIAVAEKYLRTQADVPAGSVVVDLETARELREALALAEAILQREEFYACGAMVKDARTKLEQLLQESGDGK